MTKSDGARRWTPAVPSATAEQPVTSERGTDQRQDWEPEERGDGSPDDQTLRTLELARGSGDLPALLDARPARPSVWDRLHRPLIRFGVLAALLGVWWLVAWLGIWSRTFVPTPGDVFGKLIDTSTTHDGFRGYGGTLLYEHVWASMRRIIEGSVVAILVGVPLGLLLGSSRWIRYTLEDPLTFIRSLPPLAYFSLLVIWFGLEEPPKIILLFLAALPPVVLATSDAVRNVSQDRLIALRTLGASRFQVIRHGVFPSVLPEVFTGIRVAVAFAFTTVVAAETINGMPGIGGMVRDAQRFNQTDVVILGIIVIGVCGIVLDGGIKLLDRLVVPWRGQL